MIELLVVIAIIAILASLLLPALAKAKTKATQAVCLGDHKQLALAWTMYATDNQERMVNFIEGLNGKSEIPWRYDPLPKALSLPTGTSPETRVTLTIEEGYREGALFNYAPSPGIIHCPGDTRNKLKFGKGFTYVSLSPVGPLNGETAELYKTTEIQTPSERFLWIEENDPRGENLGSWIMSPGAPPDFKGASMIDSPAVFHITSSTFSYADGHSAPHKWVDPATVKYAASMDSSKYSSAPSHNQAPNDIVWLAKGYATKLNP